jgi:hypothetical protein
MTYNISKTLSLCLKSMDIAILCETVCKDLSHVDQRLLCTDEVIRGGLRKRFALYEAVALTQLTGELVHLEDLILTTDDRHLRALSAELVVAKNCLHQREWLQALPFEQHLTFETVNRLTGEQEMGEGVIKPARTDINDAIAEIDRLLDRDSKKIKPSTNDVGPGWIASYRELIGTPIILSAAVLIDLVLATLGDHEKQRAALLGSSYIKGRGLVGEYLPTLGRSLKACNYKHDERRSPEHRITTIIDMMGHSARSALNEINKLMLARMVMLNTPYRQGSKLPELVNLLCAYPIVSIDMMAKKLNLTSQAVNQIMTYKLQGKGPREITSRRRYRAWTTL